VSLDPETIARAADVIEAARAEDRKAQKFLRTRDCAELLRVSGEFIRGEIRDGRLPAHVLQRKGRTAYRIDSGDFTVYVERYWPRAAEG
jgi:hypothetical protein